MHLLSWLPSAMAAKITLAVTDVDAGSGGVAENQGDVSAADGIQAIHGDQVLLTVTTDGVFPAVDETEDIGTEDAFVFLSSVIAANPSIGTIARTDATTYTVLLEAVPAPTNDIDTVTVTIYLLANTLPDLATGTAEHAAASLTIQYIPADPGIVGTVDTGIPTVIGIARSGSATHPIFESSVTFIVTLSEEPKGGTSNVY